MNIAEIESELLDLVDKPFEPTAFVYRFLEIYNAPKSTITKLKQGSANHAIQSGDVLWKNKIFFRAADRGKAASTVDAMLADPLTKKHKPRFVIATDGEEVYCRDTKADVAIDPHFKKLNDQFLFFLPLANIERYEAPAENPADIKATGRIAKLYDAILDANSDWIERDYTHDLNQFMTRLLFCFFAEDTSIFAKDVFTSTVMSLTNEDGSDTSAVLDLIFEAMNTKPEDRGHLPDYVKRFPYVNGGLFRDKTLVPKISKRARRLLKECGELYWKDINPDIFGSMIQAVTQPSLREDMGMHYTSIPNIMKVLHPLFLLSLEEEFLAARDAEPKLEKLLQRIYNIRVFDPACGSGNFLIIAYKELRRLEMRIFERQKEIAKQWSLPMTGVRLTQFFGIELTDFATETAKLSLWIAEYQMNELFKTAFGDAPPSLPLRDGGVITRANACRNSWEKFCPKNLKSETYIVGNPPYLGGKKLKADQSKDMDISGLSKMKRLDYICCWFIRAAEYIEGSTDQFCFVTTSSVCQGEQVHLLWSYLFKKNLEIRFAHAPFAWANSAKNNAGVFCVIVGLIKRGEAGQKTLYFDDHLRQVKNISPYLIEGNDSFVVPASKPITHRPEMCMGSNPVDGKHLIVSKADYSRTIAEHPDASRFFKRYVGGEDFLQGTERYCLWIDEATLIEAQKVPFIKNRIEACRKYRLGAGRDARKVASVPYRFCYRTHQDAHAIVYPNTSAASRLFIPAGFTDGNTIINKDAFAIYNPSDYIFAILSSSLHRVWLAAAGGKLGAGYRYSVKLVYNTFPLPQLSIAQKETLEDHAVSILGAREAHPGKTIAWLYDHESMPLDLLEAHKALDETLETIYIGRLFRNDTERLEHLFKLYGGVIKKNDPKILKNKVS